MSRKIWSKVKESELVQTIKQHPLATIFSIVFAFTSIYFLGFIFLFGLVAVISKEMLKALIEAEATILGFFGLITVYALTSLDTRIDKLEQQLHARIFDIKEKFSDLGGVKKTYLTERLSNIKEEKRKTVYSALYAGVLLVGSLLSSILGLGIPIEEWAFYLCSLSVLLFFFGIGQTLLMIYDLAKT